MQKHRRSIALSLSALLLVSTSSCGTLLYPERRGQTKGEIDPAVAILDGIGVLFFIVPGLIAFAIDFNTGAIYLPPERSTKSDDSSDATSEWERVELAEAPTPEGVRAAIARERGTEIPADANNWTLVGTSPSVDGDLLP